MPGYVKHYDEMRERGVDLVACVSVNDAFVMNAWAKTVEHNNGRVMMLADGSCLFTQAMVGALQAENCSFFTHRDLERRTTVSNS